MADDKTTKTPEQPVTDTGPGKETPPTPPKEPEKVSVSPEPEKKTEPEVKNPQVSVYGKRHYSKDKNSSPSMFRTSSIGIFEPSCKVIRRSKSSTFLTVPVAVMYLPPAFRSSGWK